MFWMDYKKSIKGMHRIQVFSMSVYFLTNIDGHVMWEDDDNLWLGSSDGKICKFYNNVDNPSSYNDNGSTIVAYWDTPDLDGKLFYKNKTFRYVAVRLAAAIVTGVKIYVQKRGLWNILYDAGVKARYFDWNYVNFAKFTFSTDKTPRTLGGKVKVKKVDKAKFRLENREINEPFGIYSFALEYTESGNYKG